MFLLTILKIEFKSKRSKNKFVFFKKISKKLLKIFNFIFSKFFFSKIFMKNWKNGLKLTELKNRFFEIK